MFFGTNMNYIRCNLKELIFRLFFLFIFSKFSLSTLIKNSKNIFISKIDVFPHNIEKNFTFTVKHPLVEYHNLYAIFILEVKCVSKFDVQKIYFFPGFLKESDHDIKETRFHVLNFRIYRFYTSIIVRFLREASECIFKVEYSPNGAEKIHLNDPTDVVVVYEETILLFRPAILKLSVVSEDGHRGGLSIGKPGIVECAATDGFPQLKPILIFSNDITTVGEVPIVSGDSVSINVIAALKDHGANVTCKCGSVSKNTNIKVFHHALSVQIIPNKQYWFKQVSSIQCKSSGDGYPLPIVKWTVSNLNDSSRQFFTIISSSLMSTIHINAITPNLSTWSLNCSSVNTIPPLHTSGPFLLLNITIGENVASSTMLSGYLWIIGVLVTLILIVVAITFVCASNHFNCGKSKKVLKEDDQSMPQYLSVDQHEVDGDHTSINKDQDCFV